MEQHRAADSNHAPRIVLIGLCPPYRGGIAQHTHMLQEALAPRSDLRVYSFTRSYPRCIFPGSDTHETGGRRPSPGVSYTLDPYRPWTWPGLVREIRDSDPALVIICWWTFFWAPCLTAVADGLQKAGVPVCALCHNLFDHDAAAWKRRLARRFLSRRTRFIVHASAYADELKDEVPGADVLVYPHPLYTQYPAPAAIRARRAPCELLFAGLVRPYKGLDVLWDAFRTLPAESFHLTVAGEWWHRDAALHGALQRAPNVELMDRYLTDDELANALGRADAVVLPYRRASGSGILGLAYAYGKPVVASRVGGPADDVADGKSGLLVPAGDAPALAETLTRFAAMPTEHWAEGIAAATARMSWSGLAERILDWTAAP